jgi:hypothetical protein
MPDVTLVDISQGVRSSWTAAGASVTGTIPLTKLFFQRQPEGAELPYCVFEFKDVSAYFGGTEYFSGNKYVKATQITFKIYGASDFALSTFATAVNSAFGWGSASPAGVWTIPNATILSAMPEVESQKLEEERIDGKDVIRYETTFTVKMEADRGT